MAEKVYYIDVGEHSQRQGHLGKFRVNRTLSLAMCREEGGENQGSKR